VEIGWYIPNCHYGLSLDHYTNGKPFPPGLAIDPESFAAVACEAEQVGIDTLWLGDHVIIPPTASVAQGNLRAGDPLRADGPIYDCLSVLSYLAAITTTVKLGIGVIVIPYRNPVVMAKSLASIDLLSGGRVIAGCGVGWLQDEFDTLAVPFESRGPMTDEYLDVMKACWTQERPEYEGKYYRLDGRSPFWPKPVNGTVPLWIGAWAKRGLRRRTRSEGTASSRCGCSRRVGVTRRRCRMPPRRDSSSPTTRAPMSIRVSARPRRSRTTSCASRRRGSTRSS
jgi:probable F420-dependent oxidoreductase